MAAIGLLFGSFYGVIVDRLPLGRSIVHPPSSCPRCSHRLGFLDLIPVVSYVASRGRCRHCGGPISLRYPLLEVATALGFAGAYALAGGSWPLSVSWAVFYSFLLNLCLIDIDHMLLPDRLTLPGLASGLILAAAGWSTVSLVDALAGAAVGYAVLWTIGFVTGGKMGGGDMKLLALIGAFLGVKGALYALFGASVVGSLVGGILIAIGRHNRGKPIPFGPFLAIGAVAVAVVWNL